MKNTVMTCDKSVVKRNLWFGVFLFVIQNLLAQAAPYKYVIAETPWAETFGNHRAVVEVARPVEVVHLSFEWRRHDANINNTRFLLISAASGDTIRNIRRMEVDNERCSLLFGPVLEKGTYYFYYLPHRVEEGQGFCDGTYLEPEQPLDVAWQQAVAKQKRPLEAEITSVEARTPYDSFYPTEVIATQAEELECLKKCSETPLLLFPEDRKYPIIMKQNIPLKWLAHDQNAGFAGVAAPGEYYTFQIGVWAGQSDLSRVRSAPWPCSYEPT